MSFTPRLAPELAVTSWLNTPDPISLAELRGRIVVIEAFQMLCPGCVNHGLPLLSRIAETFSADDVVPIGLHTVFEHHEVQGSRAALQAFLHEYRIKFPVGIDAPSLNGEIPTTMHSYQLKGTPSLLVIDQQGYLRQQTFGHVSDMAIGALLGQLRHSTRTVSTIFEPADANCTDAGCSV